MTVAAPPATKLTNFINGQWADSHASEWRDVVNPATGEVLAIVPLAAAGAGLMFATSAQTSQGTVCAPPVAPTWSMSSVPRTFWCGSGRWLCRSCKMKWTR